MDEFMRIVYPADALCESEKKLLDYYTNQYGKEYSSLIKKRIDNTIYIFESTPDITYNYLQENQKYVFDFEYMDEVEKLAANYCKLERNLEEKRRDSLYSLFCYYHEIHCFFHKQKFHEIIEIIDNIQNECFYKEKCIKLGIRPIEQREKLIALKKNIAQINRDKSAKLLLMSKWGQGLRKTLLEVGLKFTDESFTGILDSTDRESVACCCNLSKTIVFLPLIKNSYDGYLDRVFLHENRHAIEAIPKTSIGLKTLNGDFKILNEVRTEMHAIDDDKNLDVIFSKRTENNITFHYEFLFPLCEEFIKEHQTIIDRCALLNDRNEFLQTFGKKDIFEYSAMLEKVYREYQEFFTSGAEYFEVDSTEYLDKIKVLKKNAKNKGNFIY